MLGRKLQLVAYDDGGDAEKARTFAKRLLEQDKVDVIVGGSTTGTTMAAVPLAEAAGTPFISLAGAVVIVEPVKKWVFKTPHTDRMACEKIFVDMQARKLSKIALISGAGGFDKSMRAECLKVAPEVRHRIRRRRDLRCGRHRHDVAAHQDQGQRRAGRAQRRLRPGPGDRHPQLPPGRPHAAAVPVARRRFEGVHQAVRTRLPKACACRPPRCWWRTCSPRATRRSPSSSRTRRTTSDKFKSDVSTFGGHAYDGLMLAVKAIKASGSTDKAKVRDALEATKGYVGTAGVVNMSPTDHMGLDLSAFGCSRSRTATGRWSSEPRIGQPCDGQPVWLQFVASGLTAGAIYALVALGFSIIFNASGAINFAQGEFVMIGGMSAVTLLAAWAAARRGRCRWPCWRRWSSALLLEKLAIEPARHAGTVTLIIITIGVVALPARTGAAVWDKGVHRLPAFSSEQAASSSRRDDPAAKPVGARRRRAGGGGPDLLLQPDLARQGDARDFAQPARRAARGNRHPGRAVRQLRAGGSARCARRRADRTDRLHVL